MKVPTTNLISFWPLSLLSPSRVPIYWEGFNSSLTLLARSASPNVFYMSVFGNCIGNNGVIRFDSKRIRRGSDGVLLGRELASLPYVITFAAMAFVLAGNFVQQTNMN